MPYSLSVMPKTRYSKSEQKIFKMLGSNRKSSMDISEKYFFGDIPLHGRKVVIGLLTGLRRKVELNKEPFRIRATRRAGPRPCEFWVEKMKS